MAKDPAVLIYTNDFLSGTITFTDEQVGKYTRMLFLQHQKERLSENEVRRLSGQDEEIMEKFKTEVIDGKLYYFNQKMRDEAIKRRNFTQSRRNNFEGNKEKTHKKDDMDSHMEIHKGVLMEDENRDEDRNDNEVENEKENEVGNKIEVIDDSKKKINFDLVLQYWNIFAKKCNLPEIRAITEGRKRKILSRSQEAEFDFKQILYEIHNSNFLLGRVNHFKVTFDWIFESQKNYLKIIEGNYKNGEVNTNYKGYNGDDDKWESIFRQYEAEAATGQAQSEQIVKTA